ncbi:hypothetical protein GDO81_005733 [Engystomops pustulosus]|uniref:Uncharacterized protein n=1 Tax=Engystomops pustulosus TaxID=76066 RepID=A0AAV7CRL2_ENGPU|nr:hypothetical protein GDO81_005733 [Engystomops pustulosus]
MFTFITQFSYAVQFWANCWNLQIKNTKSTPIIGDHFLDCACGGCNCFFNILLHIKANPSQRDAHFSMYSMCLWRLHELTSNLPVFGLRWAD